MDQSWLENPHLKALARTGLATHFLLVSDGLADADTADEADLAEADEMPILDLVDALIEEPVFRLGIGAYALAAEDSRIRALTAAIRASFPDLKVDLVEMEAEPPAPVEVAEPVTDDPADVLRRVEGTLLRTEARLDDIESRLATPQGGQVSDLSPILERLDAMRRELGKTAPATGLADLQAALGAIPDTEVLAERLASKLAGPLKGAGSAALDDLAERVADMALETKRDGAHARLAAEKLAAIAARVDALPDGRAIEAVARKIGDVADRQAALQAQLPSAEAIDAAIARSLPRLLDPVAEQVTDLGATMRNVRADGRAASDTLAALDARLSALPDADASRALAAESAERTSEAAERALAPVIETLTALAARLSEPAGDEAALALRAAIEHLSGKLDTVAGPPAPALEEIVSRLEGQTSEMGTRIDAALARLADRLEQVVESLAERAGRLDLPTIALQISDLERNLKSEIAAARIEAPVAAPADAGVLDELRTLFERQSARLDEVAATAAQPGTLPDLMQEKQGIVQVSLALQSMLRRLDAQITRLEETELPEVQSGSAAAGQEETAQALTHIAGRIEDRLDAVMTELTAGLPSRELEARLQAIAETLRRLAAPAVDGAGVARLSVGFGSILRRLDEQAQLLEARTGALEGGETGDLVDRLETLADRLAGTGAVAMPNEFLHDIKLILAEFLAQVDRRIAAERPAPSLREESA